MRSEPPNITESMATAIADWVRLTTSAVGGRIEEWNGVLMCDFESTHPYRNAAVITSDLRQVELEELYGRLERFYRRDYGWTLIGVSPLEVDGKRLRCHLTEPIMLLDDPDSFVVPAIDGLTIVDVTDEAGVRQFERLRAEMYPVPHLHTADERELWTGAVLNGSNHLFIGYMDGLPVATGGSWETDTINEITSLATRQSHRGRSIARVMMRYAIDKSDKTPVLFSSVNAQAAYERMGFRAVGGVHYWTPPRFEIEYPGGWSDSAELAVHPAHSNGQTGRNSVAQGPQL